MWHCEFGIVNTIVNIKNVNSCLSRKCVVVTYFSLLSIWYWTTLLPRYPISFLHHCSLSHIHNATKYTTYRGDL